MSVRLPFSQCSTIERSPASRFGRGRLLPALLAVFALCFALSARGDEAVTVRTGLHEGFGRLVFHWPVPIAFDALTGDRHVAIRFDRAGEIDVSEVTARLGAWLRDAGVSRSDGHSKVRLDLQPGVAVRVFRVDDYRVVVDLSAAPAPTPPPPAAPVPSAEERTTVEPQRPARPPAPPIAVPAPAAESEPEATSAAAPEPAAPPAGDVPAAHLTIASGAGDEGAHVDFAWTQPVAAAVFLRAGHLWVVFAAETSRPEDVVVPPMAPALHDDLGRGARVEASGGTALRFPLRRPLAAEVRRLDRMWRVRLSVDAQAPQAVHPRRAAFPTRLRLAPGESPRLVTLRDPDVGDRLTVWPLLQANVGQPRQRLVDLELLATVQGLAWRLRRDGVEARLLEDAVEFTAPGGLMLSEQGGGGVPASGLGTPPAGETIDPSGASPHPARTAPQAPDEARLAPPLTDHTVETAVAPLLGLVGWGLSPAS